jgi:hypothetical protein
MDVTSMIGQCLRNLVKNTQPILTRDLDNGIKIGIQVIDLHFGRNPGDDLLFDSV